MRMMKDRRFKSSIVIEPRLGRVREVRSLREAAEALLRDWPGDDLPKRQKAMATCLSALKGDVQPHRARRDFIEAAREARLLMGD
ncbi:DUF982 domain-containing protein [Aquibium oceanicum]|nr:DUF982 domain-containing protein [Aquibium oceanicum]